MNKHIAISSKDGRLSNPEEQGTKLIVFSLEDDQIVGIRDEMPSERDARSLLNWFILKDITRLYTSTISPFLHQSLVSIGITVKQKDEVADDPFYNRFIFD